MISSVVSIRLILRFLGVFVMGLACGTLITPFSASPSSLDKFFSRTNDPKERSEAMMKKFTEKFGLTGGEQKKLQPLVLEMSESIYRTRTTFGTDILKIEDDYHQKFFQVLEPDHRALFETAYAKYRKHLADAILISDPSLADKSPDANPALATTPPTTTSPNP